MKYRRRSRSNVIGGNSIGHLGHKNPIGANKKVAFNKVGLTLGKNMSNIGGLGYLDKPKDLPWDKG